MAAITATPELAVALCTLFSIAAAACAMLKPTLQFLHRLAPLRLETRRARAPAQAEAGPHVDELVRTNPWAAARRDAFQSGISEIAALRPLNSIYSFTRCFVLEAMLLGACLLNYRPTLHFGRCRSSRRPF
eukprot:2145795-Pleurochrysis_carterae.AAC.2